MSGGHCSVHMSLLGNFCHSASLFSCVLHAEQTVLFNEMLRPVLQIRPELIGRDVEVPTAACVIGAVLSVVLPILFFLNPLCGENLQSDVTYQQCCRHPECHWGVIHLKTLVGDGRLRRVKIFYPTDCNWREYSNNLNQPTQKMFKAFDCWEESLSSVFLSFLFSPLLLLKPSPLCSA